MPSTRKRNKKVKLTTYEEFEKTMKILETFDKSKEPTESEAIALIAAFEMGCTVRTELFSAAQSMPHESAVAYFLLQSSQNLNKYLNAFFEQFSKDKDIAKVDEENVSKM